MKIYKQLQGLPEELEKWGVKALDKIESPEQANRAADDLRARIDLLWEECKASDEEEKVRYVLKNLGKADVVAEAWKELYAIKKNTKVDKIVGVICLVLAGICSIHPIKVFFIYTQEIENSAVIHGVWQAGKGAGAGVVCTIIFLFFGLWLLLSDRKNEKKD